MGTIGQRVEEKYRPLVWKKKKKIRYSGTWGKRALLARRIEKYSSIIQSTKTLLGKVEQDDNERREDLEDTMRRAQEVCERSRTEQQRLEVEYKEFQNRSYVPQRRRQRKTEMKQEENFDDCRHYKTSFSQAVLVPTVTELFDSYVKSEPNY
ncbi:unnamed protein product [Angiostrongylus costaricensis]|uniref:Uncharacterized protein n=1 Tax=Angiostrongylus costaricensis TaxID=334426 RepID=A0A0R3PBX1_ANGCS|nr:unnamed protein product [Angiostrongylus costaricensis]